MKVKCEVFHASGGLSVGGLPLFLHTFGLRADVEASDPPLAKSSPVAASLALVA